MGNWVVKTIELIVKNISPSVKTALVEFVIHLDAEAKKTDNSWDDVLVGLLKLILLIK